METALERAKRPIEPIVYSIPETERVSTLCRSMVYKLIRAKKLDARKIGGRTVITAESLHRLIEQAPAA